MKESENRSLILSEELEREEKLGFPSLNAKHKVVIERYTEDFDIKRTANARGITPYAVRKILLDPLANHFLEFIIRDYAETSVLRKEWVEMEWLNLYAQLVGETEVLILDSDGIQLKGKNFNGPSAVAALKQISDMVGLGAGVGKDAGGVVVNFNMGGFGLTPTGVTAADVVADVKEVVAEVIAETVDE